MERIDFMAQSCKGLSRLSLRSLSKTIRKQFGYNNSERLNPLRMLDRLPEHLRNFSYLVLDRQDPEYPSDNAPARTEMWVEKGGTFAYRVVMQDKVYERARNDSGGDRMTICHEISHVYLLALGIVPVSKREFTIVRPYEDPEWQAKALAGELMIPYEASKGMPITEIMDIYGVSEEAAAYRYHHIK